MTADSVPNEEAKPSQSLGALSALALEGGVLGLFAYQCLLRLKELDTLSYLAAYRDFDPLWASLSLFAGAGLLLALGFKLSSLRPELSRWAAPAAAVPAFLGLPALPLQPGYWTLFLGIFVFAVCAGRLAALFPWDEASAIAASEGTESFPWSEFSIVSLASLAFVAEGVFFQTRLLGALFIPLEDWGNYIDIARNTLHGKFFWCDATQKNLFAEHFEPGTMLLLAPFAWLFQSHAPFFALNALALALPAPLLFLLARKLGLSAKASMALALLYLMHPATSNMLVGLFYAFHEDYLAASLIVLYFLLWRSGWRKAAILALIASLSVKETVAALWFFVGLAYFLKGERKHGAALALGSFLYFLVAVKLLIPFFRHGEAYPFIVRYASLGASMPEIILSPFLRPGAFLGALFKFQNVYMMSCFLLPVFFALARMPLWAFGASGLLLFVCLANATVWCVIDSWYLAEPLAVVYVALLYAFAHKGCLWSRVWEKVSFSGMTSWVWKDEGARVGMLWACGVGGALSFFLFSIFCPYGKNAICESVKVDQEWEAVERLQAQIPPGIEMSSSNRLSSHFIFRNKVLQYASPPSKFVLLDLSSMQPFTDYWETYRRRLYISGRYVPVFTEFSNRHAFILFRPKEDGLPPAVGPDIGKIDGMEAWRSGWSVETNDVGFSVKALPVPSEQGRRGLDLVARPNGKIDCDVNLIAKYEWEPGDSSLRVLKKIVPFGNGARPAYSLGPGEAFLFHLNLPSEGKGRLSVEIERKPSPDFSATSF